MAVPTFTPNLHLTKLPANYRVWSQIMNDNLTMMDAAISGFITFNNLRGGWANSTVYALSDTVVDTTTAVIYSCLVAHTSALIPTTFAADRLAHPTYWAVAAAAASARGAWATATAYNRNDFVLADGTKYAFCLVAHTSGANFTADLALGRWSVLVDLSAVGSLVLPVLSGLGDANKLVMTNPTGANYVINTITTFLGLIPSTGTLGSVVFSTSPTLTGSPIAPTQIAEDNTTKIATTAYADLAVRAMVIRRQTFSGNGTYTPHPKMIYCDTETWGGGGGGGGTANSAANVEGQGAGGGAGGYSKTIASKATIGASKAIIVGAAGTAAAAGNNNGGDGGDTSVGAICIAKGGSGGQGTNGVANSNGRGGLGGILGTGDVRGTGQSGGDTWNMTAGGVGIVTANQGGSSSIGGGGRATATVGGAIMTGEAGTGFASGGSGGSTIAVGAAGGGAGTAGFVCITEYCYG